MSNLFKKFALNVWNVSPDQKSDEAIALEGLEAMEHWMKEIGLVLNCPCGYPHNITSCSIISRIFYSDICTID